MRCLKNIGNILTYNGNYPIENSVNIILYPYLDGVIYRRSHKKLRETVAGARENIYKETSFGMRRTKKKDGRHCCFTESNLGRKDRLGRKIWWKTFKNVVHVLLNRHVGLSELIRFVSDPGHSDPRHDSTSKKMDKYTPTFSTNQNDT